MTQPHVHTIEGTAIACTGVMTEELVYVPRDGFVVREERCVACLDVGWTPVFCTDADCGCGLPKAGDVSRYPRREDPATASDHRR